MASGRSADRTRDAAEPTGVVQAIVSKQAKIVAEAAYVGVTAFKGTYGARSTLKGDTIAKNQREGVLLRMLAVGERALDRTKVDCAPDLCRYDIPFRSARQVTCVALPLPIMTVATLRAAQCGKPAVTSRR